MTTNEEYTADKIQDLDNREQVRLRPGMYLGGVDTAAVTLAVTEIYSNSFDEYLAGHGNEITVIFHADGSAEIRDNARGLPVDKDTRGVDGIRKTVGSINSGGKYDASNYAVSSGLNGVGASVVIALSSRADVNVYRGGKQHSLSFQEGIAGSFAKPLDPNSKFTPKKSGLDVVKDPRPAAEQKKNPTGTVVRFWPDYNVFQEDAHFDIEDINFRLKSAAFLMPGLKINVIDEVTKKGETIKDTYHYNVGIEEMVPSLSNFPLVSKIIHLKTDGSFEHKGTIMKNGKTTTGITQKHVDVEVAFGYSTQEEPVLRSYVNTILTKHGGTHEDGLWRALSRVLVNQAKETRGLLKAKEEPPKLEDVKDGFVGIISIKFHAPDFTGQEKSTLSTTAITSLVSKSVAEELKNWLNNKKNAAQVKILMQKIVEAKRIREAARQQKETARKKSALETATSMPAKLVACASKNPDEIELSLCEGLSALGGIKSARDSNTHAIYPLRGKPLNVYGLPVSKVLENREWSDLIQIIGAGFGKSFAIENVNYKRIILLADSDADGKHITALLLNGLWLLMKPLVEAGMVYVAMPPLFSISTRNKDKKRFYAQDEAARDKLVAELKKKGYTWDKIVRHKGLGEYSPDILHEVVMNPETRVLKRVTVENINDFNNSLDLALGKSAERRRDWIIASRNKISDSELDF